jgi:GTP cyclohydrolase IA
MAKKKSPASDLLKFAGVPRISTIVENTPKMSESESLKFAAVTRFPTPIVENPPAMSEEEKIAYIAERFKDIMEVLGLDLNDDSLARTPYRVAKMYVREIFSGLDIKQFPQISFIEDRFEYQQRPNMVFVKVNFNSFCEHHFVPMNGTAFVAYIPNGKLIGLSKIPRIVRFFAFRPQVQERLTAQIADSLSTLLDTAHVAVSLTAQHYCIIARGIEDTESHTITNVLRGDFDTDETRRHEFFEAINRAHPSCQ